MLYIFGGLPATGKTELARFLSSMFGAVHIRVDTIEQTLKNSGVSDLYDEGYKVACALALENLKNGIPVIADSTNPVAASREAWLNVARTAESSYIEIEVICSDQKIHRERVEKRLSDIPNLILPSWESVTSRKYQQWQSACIVLDTSGKTPEQSKQELNRLIMAHNETKDSSL